MSRNHCKIHAICNHLLTSVKRTATCKESDWHCSTAVLRQGQTDHEFTARKPYSSWSPPGRQCDVHCFPMTKRMANFAAAA